MCNHDTYQSNSAKPEIIHNRGRCKLCGDIIESTDRHEFVTCRCGACSVDGGHDYLRRCFASPDYFEELSVIKPCGDSYENASDSNPKSDPDAVIDAAAKRILEEYRDAFTELAKGSDGMHLFLCYKYVVETWFPNLCSTLLQDGRMCFSCQNRHPETTV